MEGVRGGHRQRWNDTLGRHRVNTLPGRTGRGLISDLISLVQGGVR